MIDLGDGIVGQLRASELSRDRVEDARSILKEGDEIEAKFTGLDRKSRVLSLSVKAKEAHDEEQVVKSYKKKDETAGTSLGALIKEKISSKD